ncbi:helix-turn-helix domain-containing protein [Nocardia sp. NPDC003345]
MAEKPHRSSSIVTSSGRDRSRGRRLPRSRDHTHKCDDGLHIVPHSCYSPGGSHCATRSSRPGKRSSRSSTRTRLRPAQAELAGRAGLTQAKISRIEGADTVPTLPLLAELADALDATLISLSTSMPPR